MQRNTFLLSGKARKNDGEFWSRNSVRSRCSGRFLRMTTSENFVPFLARVWNTADPPRFIIVSTFSFYVNHWWRAAKPYVDRERMVHGDDKSLFGDFEKLAIAWQHRDPEIDDEKLKKFL